MSAVQPSPSSHIYRLLPHWRWLSWVPLVALAGSGVLMFAILSGTAVWWWSFWMLAPVAVLAGILALGFSRLRLEIDGRGVRYHGLGYASRARWEQVTYRATPRKVLLIDSPAIEWAPWLGWMLPIVEVVLPFRADLAKGALRSVPLWYFDDGTLETVVRGHLGRR